MADEGPYARHHTANAGPPALLRQRAFPGRPEQVREARHWIASVLPACEPREVLVQIASEFCANTIEHTRSGAPGGQFTVHLAWSARTARLTVAAPTEAGGHDLGALSTPRRGKHAKIFSPVAERGHRPGGGGRGAGAGGPRNLLVSNDGPLTARVKHCRGRVGGGTLEAMTSTGRAWRAGVHEGGFDD